MNRDSVQNSDKLITITKAEAQRITFLNDLFFEFRFNKDLCLS